MSQPKRDPLPMRVLAVAVDWLVLALAIWGGWELLMYLHGLSPHL